jgi:hypothetical protein
MLDLASSAPGFVGNARVSICGRRDCAAASGPAVPQTIPVEERNSFGVVFFRLPKVPWLSEASTAESPHLRPTISVINSEHRGALGVLGTALEHRFGCEIRVALVDILKHGTEALRCNFLLDCVQLLGR